MPDPRLHEKSPYKRTIYDRMGSDAGTFVMANVWGCAIMGVFLVIGYLIATLLHIHGLQKLGVMLGASLLAGAGMRALTLAIGAASGKVVNEVLWPSGMGYVRDFSYQEALAARGDVAGALASYEAVMRDSPADPEPRLRAAELCAKGGQDLQRAATLFRSVQGIPGVPAERLLYASHRLVDLYLGPLAEPGRALVELRRIIERFPGSAAAAQARTALTKLKQ